MSDLTDADYTRIYALFERASDKATLDANDREGYHPDMEEALEAVQMVYGDAALCEILTGRSPRSGAQQ